MASRGAILASACGDGGNLLADPNWVQSLACGQSHKAPDPTMDLSPRPCEAVLVTPASPGLHLEHDAT
jgi:hypothetical protein